MPDQAYDCTTRRGVHPVSWADFHGICKALARAASRFDPQIVLAVGDVLREWGTTPGYLELVWLTLERTEPDNLLQVATELVEIRQLTARLMELA